MHRQSRSLSCRRVPAKNADRQEPVWPVLGIRQNPQGLPHMKSFANCCNLIRSSPGMAAEIGCENGLELSECTQITC
ncbi:MAG TPA: hypothetical protein DIT89_05885 [Planctomycetaceae bacterium]|nr:hypothetical protein [Planctomycetaceae bacterium]